MKQKILNLYAGIGGNRRKWPDDEIEVTAVEKDPKIGAAYSELFPNDRVVIGDAHEFLKNHFNEFGFIWSSPPCQSHSRLAISGQNKTPQFPDLSLYEEILFLKQFHRGRWVVENVRGYYDPLLNPIRFGRHLFWTNFAVYPTKVRKSYPNFIKEQTLDAAEKMKTFYDLPYSGTIYYQGNHCPTQVLRNAVDPEIGLHIFNESKRTGLFSNSELDA